MLQAQHSRSMVRDAIEILEEIFVDYYTQPDAKPVLRYQSKEEVIGCFARPTAPRQGIGLSGTLDLFRDTVLAGSVRTWHPTFLNQMSAGSPLTAVLGDTMAAMMNGTLSTFEASPAATVIERNVTQWMARILGMKSGSSGIFLPGGSLGNLLALSVARNSRLGPECRDRGLQGMPRKGAILCSEATHYSISNAANLLGIGSDQVLEVRTNERNEMLVEGVRERLQECWRRGLKPFALVATMGVTVTGGFDPLRELVPICKDWNMHLHVDAAFGGGMALTRAGDALFDGIAEADTVIWDAHKWLGVPLTASVLLLPDASLLEQNFCTHAQYLFHPQDEELAMGDDLGHSTPLCGKRFQALPVWFLFHAFGEEFFRTQSEGRLSMTRELANHIEEEPDFELAYEPVSPVLCFRFRPSGRGLESGGIERLDRLQWSIRESIRKRGLALFNVASIHGRNYFRLILINPLTTMREMTPLLRQIRAVGYELLEQEEVFAAAKKMYVGSAFG